jgi:hypothetical protein
LHFPQINERNGSELEESESLGFPSLPPRTHPFPWCCAAACVSLPPTSNFGVTGRRGQSAFAFGFRLHRILTRHFGVTDVAASRQSAAFFPPPIFRWRLSPESRYAPELAERLDCGDFSTAFRPHGEYPPFQPLRPPDSAAEAGALQTLRDFRHNRVGQCFQPVSIQKIRDNATSPPSTQPSPPGEEAAADRLLAGKRHPANSVARHSKNAANDSPSPP